MSLWYQYIQGNITREELDQLIGKPCDTSEVDKVEIRTLDDNGKPISDWTIVSRFYATGIVGKYEIREIKFR